MYVQMQCVMDRISTSGAACVSGRQWLIENRRTVARDDNRLPPLDLASRVSLSYPNRHLMAISAAGPEASAPGASPAVSEGLRVR